MHLLSQPSGIRLPAGVAFRGSLTYLRDGTLVLSLILPFAGQVLPYGFPLFSLIVCLTFGVALLCRGWSDTWRHVRVPLNPYTVLLCVVLLTVLYGVVLTNRVDGSLIGEMFNAISVLILYAAAVNTFSSAEHRDALLRYTMNVLLTVALTGAICGALKFMLLLRGHQLAFLQDPSSGRYPFGTSLVNDYNMFSLTLLCGAVIALTRAMENRKLLGRIFPLTAFFLLVAVGTLAGSRRFWLVTPLAVVGVIGLSLLRMGFGRGTKRVMVFTMVSVALVASALTLFEQSNWSAMDGTYRRLEIRLSSLLDADRAGGFDDRLIRWQYASALAEGPPALTGQGFDYLRMFSCRFGDCKSADYPHNPVLSALLYAGIAGVTAVLGLFGWVVYSACRLLRARPIASTCGMLLLIHLPFILVSSNSVLSVKSFLVSAMLCTFYGDRLRTRQSVSGDWS